MKVSGFIIALVISLVALVSCTSLRHDAPSDLYWDAQRLEMQLAARPDDPMALRELGILYLRSGDYGRARDVLRHSVAEDASSPRSWLYLGLVHELLGDPDSAVAAYARGRALSAANTYSRLIEGRYRRLVREDEAQEFNEVLGQALEGQEPPLRVNTYAVFPLVCGGTHELSDRIAPAISSAMAFHLQQVEGARVIAPERLDDLLEVAEVYLDASGAEAREAISRALGAGSMVEGSCEIDAGSLRLDLTLRDLVNEELHQAREEGSIDNVVLLQQEAVGRLVEQQGFWSTRPRDLPLERVRAASASGLDAMVAYADGLADETSGDYPAAVDHYREAVRQLNSFAPAAERLRAASTLVAAEGGDEDGILTLVSRLESASSLPMMIEARFHQLGVSLGSGGLFGTDPRTLPPADIGELPLPPIPE